MPLLALTIKQPFASAILAGAKKIENRTWSPPSALVGQWFAIHAAADRRDHPGWARVGHLWRPPDDLPRGAILGLVRLVAVHLPGQHQTPWSLPDCFGWELADPEIWDPVAATGRLGLWRV